MIHVDRLSKAFGANLVLDEVSFAIEPGEIVLLLGGNGVGKSTLLRCLLGLVSYQGSILVAGLDPSTAGREVRRRVGYMPQGIALHLDLTVAETLRFYTELRHADPARAQLLLAEVELTHKAHALVGELSGGMRQRLQFALALLDDPAVLLLDEPTASLDRASCELLVSRLDALARAGKTILVSTHASQSLAGVAVRAIELAGGQARSSWPEPDRSSVVVHAGSNWQVAVHPPSIETRRVSTSHEALS
jgi:ABC-2 type transport system ATP-binding protein/nitrous oxidase accessory protein